MDRVGDGDYNLGAKHDDLVWYLDVGRVGRVIVSYLRTWSYITAKDRWIYSDNLTLYTLLIILQIIGTSIGRMILNMRRQQ
jgi:hypothetical protein